MKSSIVELPFELRNRTDKSKTEKKKKKGRVSMKVVIEKYQEEQFLNQFRQKRPKQARIRSSKSSGSSGLARQRTKPKYQSPHSPQLPTSPHSPHSAHPPNSTSTEDETNGGTPSQVDQEELKNLMKKIVARRA
eukprot:GHVN01062611.1.p1 GENE.GHVN01062611.1~~GHVN01062611.1.p1  ORF type:complete len:134 (+),score=39.79 GHVN01062611.1:57-458(+)